jgi:exopolysaccharide production protein ExoY
MEVKRMNTGRRNGSSSGMERCSGDELSAVETHGCRKRSEKDPTCGGAETSEIPVLSFPRWKRVLDLTCVVATLPCWILIMVLVTLWIRMVSPGPTFYRQERIGYRGRRFKIFKFRSMKVNVETRTHEDYFTRLIHEKTPMKKLDAAGDPRLIFGGRVLRALGLDELPQILNVVRGEMSLVGPRPCTPHEFQHYQEWQRERVKAPPGLTGLWQVNGKNKTTFDEMIQMDFLYAERMSPLLDLKVILMTIPAIFAQVIDSRNMQRRQQAGMEKQVSL